MVLLRVSLLQILEKQDIQYNYIAGLTYHEFLSITTSDISTYIVQSPHPTWYGAALLGSAILDRRNPAALAEPLPVNEIGLYSLCLVQYF